MTLLASCGGNGSKKQLTIVPTPGAIGSASLQWIAPTENEDGSPLTDLAGFTVYVGTASGLYTHEHRIENPSISVYLVEQLDSGSEYFFVVTAFNAADHESDFSNEVSKSIE